MSTIDFKSAHGKGRCCLTYAPMPGGNGAKVRLVSAGADGRVLSHDEDGGEASILHSSSKPVTCLALHSSGGKPGLVAVGTSGDTTVRRVSRMVLIIARADPFPLSLSLAAPLPFDGARPCARERGAAAAGVGP